MSSIKVTGINGEITKMKLDFGNTRKKVKHAAVLIAADLGRKASKYAPVLTGNLRDSEFDRVEDLGVGIGFKMIVGFDTPYALRMHESHYRPSHPGTGRKYLQRATDENYPKYKARLEAIGDKK